MNITPRLINPPSKVKAKDTWRWEQPIDIPTETDMIREPLEKDRRVDRRARSALLWLTVARNPRTGKAGPRKE
jgi:hypothetical protein